MNQEVYDFQTNLLKTFDFHERQLDVSEPHIFVFLRQCDDEILELAFGDFGLKLKWFAEHIDVSHLELKNKFNLLFEENSDFCNKCYELIQLTKLAKQQGLSQILPNIKQLFCEESNSEFAKMVNFPKPAVRLLKDVKQREGFRNNKKLQSIDLQETLKYSVNWDIQPYNLSDFARYRAGYKDVLSSCKKRADRYFEIGCSHLYEEMKNAVEGLQKEVRESHYGFLEVPVINLAIILAKFMGHELVFPSPNAVYSIYRTNKIIVNKKIFKEYKFSSLNEDIRLEYAPRIYPLSDFAELASTEVNNIIKYLDSFPKVGHKPIFDYFAVIVPGVNFPVATPYQVANKNGLIVEHADLQEAKYQLDKILIKEKYITPIIVGEKDGRCYFISYFTVNYHDPLKRSGLVIPTLSNL